MNIAQLFHCPTTTNTNTINNTKYQTGRDNTQQDCRPLQKTIQFMPHWPTFTITEQSKTWHFYSAEGKTLRKKRANTSLIKFLQSQHIQEQQQTRATQEKQYFLLVIKIIDYRKYDDDLYPITVDKVLRSKIMGLEKNKNQSLYQMEERVIDQNNWKVRDYEKIILIRMDNMGRNHDIKAQTCMNTLYWSENIISSQAPLSNYLKNKLTEYGEIIKKKVQSTYYNGQDRVKGFQLVFSYGNGIGNSGILEGKIKFVLLHNFTIRGGYAWRTNLKIGYDQYQKIELLLADDNNIANHKQSTTEQYYQMKRLRYINLLRKINDNKRMADRYNVLVSKQNDCNNGKDYQCCACKGIGDGNTERLVSANRIAQIQIMRQVKMKKNNIDSANYDLVKVCELCYQQFLIIVQQNQCNKSNKLHKKQNSKQKSHQQKGKYMGIDEQFSQLLPSTVNKEKSQNQEISFMKQASVKVYIPKYRNRIFEKQQQKTNVTIQTMRSNRKIQTPNNIPQIPKEQHSQKRARVSSMQNDPDYNNLSLNKGGDIVKDRKKMNAVNERNKGCSSFMGPTRATSYNRHKSVMRKIVSKVRDSGDESFISGISKKQSDVNSQTPGNILQALNEYESFNKKTQSRTKRCYFLE